MPVPFSARTNSVNVLALPSHACSSSICSMVNTMDAASATQHAPVRRSSCHFRVAQASACAPAILHPRYTSICCRTAHHCSGGSSDPCFFLRSLRRSCGRPIAIAAGLSRFSYAFCIPVFIDRNVPVLSTGKTRSFAFESCRGRAMLRLSRQPDPVFVLALQCC